MSCLKSTTDRRRCRLRLAAALVSTMCLAEPTMAVPKRLPQPKLINFRPVSFVLHFDDNGKPISDDPRGALSLKAKELGLSDDEVREIRANTGYVLCEGKKTGGVTVGSGALFGRNGMQVLTNVHAIRGERGQSREPCYFQNQATRPTRIRLVVEDRFLGSEETAWIPDEDIAGIRLSEKIPGADGLSLDVFGAPLKSRQEVIMISASQNWTKSIPPNEPVAQICQVIDVLLENSVFPTGLYGDCWATAGASGSIGLVRTEGRLRIKMLHWGDGTYSREDEETSRSKDYHPYSRADKSYSYAIGIDGKIARALDEFANEGR